MYIYQWNFTGKLVIQWFQEYVHDCLLNTRHRTLDKPEAFRKGISGIDSEQYTGLNSFMRVWHQVLIFLFEVLDCV